MTIETGPPDDSYDDNVEFLIDSFPEYMENDTTSGNWKLLSPIGDQFDSVEDNLQSVSRATVAQEAKTIEQLEKIAALVDLQPHKDETREHFRARIISEFQILTSEGTITDLLNATATILKAEIDDIRYTEQVSTAGVCQLGVPTKQTNKLELSDLELVEIVDQLIPSGYAVNLYKTGTFTYLSPSRWINSRKSNNTGTFTFISSATYKNSNHDSAKGHDQLDNSGNPANTGGTYSGLFVNGKNGLTKGYDGLDNNGNPKDNNGTYAGIIN